MGHATLENSWKPGIRKSYLVHMVVSLWLGARSLLAISFKCRSLMLNI